MIEEYARNGLGPVGFGVVVAFWIVAIGLFQHFRKRPKK